MQNKLQKIGFVRDLTAPYVNRYEKSEDDNWFSITLTQDGEKTEYGVFLFGFRDFGNTKKRKFTGDVTLDELLAIMDLSNDNIPSIVRQFPFDPLK